MSHHWLAVMKARSNPGGEGQVTHDWLLKQYRRKLTEQRMDPARVPKFKLHTPRIIGATTLFASGKVTDMHMKAKGRWSGDIAYIYARFCPDMDRDAVRAMGMTDATPFLENADGSNPDVYVTGSDEIRVFYHPLASQNTPAQTCHNDGR